MSRYRKAAAYGTGENQIKGSAIFDRYTMPRYQTQFPGNGLLDTDNACHHLAAVSGGQKRTDGGGTGLLQC
jgi:hypothetical protein